MRSRSVLSVPVLAGILTVGCIIDVAIRAEYDSCFVGDTCSGLSSCQPVGVAGGTGNICTYSCNPTQPRSCGGDAVCIGTGATLTTAGQCYRLCTTSGTCPGLSGTVCARIDLGLGGLQTLACIPGVAGGGTAQPITRLPTYAKCDPGNTTMACEVGFTCAPSAVSSQLGRAIGNTCTRSCAQASDCPGGVGFAACVNGFCAPSCSNPGSFDQRCAMFGTACTAANSTTGGMVSFCVP
jgi:hypothetical protein